MRGLAEDRNIIIKPADKGSCVVLCDREDYLAEAENNFKMLIYMKILTSRNQIWLSW